MKYLFQAIMTQDIKLFQDQLTNQWDIDFENGDFALTEGLDTALYMSVLCEARANSTLVPNPILRRGHFSDIFSIQEGYQIGSVIWIYSHLPNTEGNAELLKSALYDSIQWMIDDSIISQVIINVDRKVDGYDIQINLTNRPQEQANYYNLFVATFK